MTHPRRSPSFALSAGLALALALPLTTGTLMAAQGEAPAAAPTAKGKELVDQNCIKCHGSEVYTRSDRKVTSLDGLSRQVSRCETSLGLTWFEEDVSAVADYLNDHFYHFK